jgi:thioredoxin 2
MIRKRAGATRRFGIQSIPTLLLMHGGEVLARHIGAAPESELRRWVEEALVRAQAGASS